MKDEYLTSMYESCSAALEQLQEEGDLTPEEEGFENLCEVIVYLYDELYNTPTYVKCTEMKGRVLH